MYENMKIYNYENLTTKNIQISKHTNTHAEKYKCEKCKSMQRK